MHLLIVDDEPLARARLRTLLADWQAQQPPVRLQVQEAANVAQALDILAAPSGRTIDVLLLDVHMPGQDGLALAQTLQQRDNPPAVVFVTAHADHAVAAFELNAVDYLTKPVRLARLQQALMKAQRQHPASPSAASLDNPRPAVASPSYEKTAEHSLLIQERGRTERIPLHEVLYLKAEQKYLTLRTLGRTYVLDGTLNDWETQHSPHLLRIHRNALVARHAVRALEKHGDLKEGEYWAVRLQGLAQWLPVSRRQVAAVRQALATESVNAPDRAPTG